MAGVWVHAHAVSQLISAMEDQRSQIRRLPQRHNLQWGDAIWILGSSLVTGAIVRRLRSRLLWLGVAIAMLALGLHQTSSISLSQGIWLPFILTLFAVFVTAIGVIFNLKLQRRSM